MFRLIALSLASVFVVAITSANAAPKVAALVSQSGAQVSGLTTTPSCSGSCWTQISFTSANATYDTPIGYIGTNEFTVPEDGIYSLHIYSAYTAAAGSDPTVGFAYDINGATILGIQQKSFTSGEQFTFNGSKYEKLSAGDVIRFYVIDNQNQAFTQINLSVQRQ